MRIRRLIRWGRGGCEWKSHAAVSLPAGAGGRESAPRAPFNTCWRTGAREKMLRPDLHAIVCGRIPTQERIAGSHPSEIGARNRRASGDTGGGHRRRMGWNANSQAYPMGRAAGATGNRTRR